MIEIGHMVQVIYPDGRPPEPGEILLGPAADEGGVMRWLVIHRGRDLAGQGQWYPEGWLVPQKRDGSDDPATGRAAMARRFADWHYGPGQRGTGLWARLANRLLRRG